MCGLLLTTCWALQWHSLRNLEPRWKNKLAQIHLWYYHLHQTNDNTGLSLSYILTLNFIPFWISSITIGQWVGADLGPHPNMELIYIYICHVVLSHMYWADYVGLHLATRSSSLRSVLHLVSLKSTKCKIYSSIISGEPYTTHPLITFFLSF